MGKFFTEDIPKSERITKLVKDLYAKLPEIESARAKLITKSYQQTQDQPMVIRRAIAFADILREIPIIIREDELIVGSTTIAPRGCQTYPEFSFEWLEKEYDTVEHRSADPFYISPETVKELKEVNPYWKGKTTSDLAKAYMAPETLIAMDHSVFTPGNYFYNGVGHVCVNYEEVIAIGYEGIKERVQEELSKVHVGDGDYAKRSHFLEAVLISIDAVIGYAKRYSELASQEAVKCKDATRKNELLVIAKNCEQVPARGARNFYEACQSFWFIQQLLQLESSGHSISPGRFDRYMYPYFKKDMDEKKITRELAQEILDCVFVKLNDLNKCRDAVSAEGFAGYSLFQNMIVGGQDEEGNDTTNDLSFMCINASEHVFLPQPSLSVRVWNKTPHELLVKAAKLTKTGIGFPAYYNDEVIIPGLLNRGLTLQDARDYCIIGCVEPQKAGKTNGWHDAAFYNMLKPLELTFSSGYDKGELVGIETKPVEEMTTYEEFFEAYKQQTAYLISLLVNADNSIDAAHAERCPLPFLSCMVRDCIKNGKSFEEGGAVYNFTGPQGFGIANMADALYAVDKLVFQDKTITMGELKKILTLNFGKGFDERDAAAMALQVIGNLKKEGQEVATNQIAQIVKSILEMQISDEDRKLCEKIYEAIEEMPKYGNDLDEVDTYAVEAAYTYTKPLQTYKNPRGGIFQAGLYPVSANVPLGAQTGATPDGRLAHMPIADGVSPAAGRDVNGPTAATNSVSKLDHLIASNGTLLNMKFHPSALAGENGIDNFIALIRGYFDRKGSHMQFNVVDRKTLLDAQEHPENYRHLVVRVAGYSALFTTLSKSLQDDIIRRTEQGF